MLGLGLNFWRAALSGSGPSIAITATSIAEDAEVGDLIGSLSVINSPDGVTWAFSLDSGTSSQVELDGVDDTRLEVAEALDFETAPSLTAVVIATPSVDDPITRQFTISVTNVAPVLSSLTVEADSETTMDGTVSTTEASGTLYWVITTSATPPTAAQIIAGQDHTGAAAVFADDAAVASSGSQAIAATGLTAETTYYAHVIHQDGGGANSNIESETFETILPSLARTLAGTFADEADSFAIVFADDHYFADTGFYGSAWIGDSGTPANDYDNSPVTSAASLLSYTSPSNKMILQASGLVTFSAHNLYLNSAAPANQAITVVSGATYAITITGSVSVTASGAATGTWTAGTQTFTAATTTLTLGSTSGAGTVHVRRTPSVDTYLATTSAARYALPIEFDTSGDPIGLLVEEARTNLAIHNNDFTNAVWSKTNVTAAKTATGPDGVANSASTLTATSNNGTALQSITSGSAARITACYIKRRTGTGNLDMTQDNGSTWATVVDTANWTRVNIAAATLANPIVGFRIATSGDEFDVALFTHEVGAFVTSPIPTLGSTVTRVADALTIETSLFPHNAAGWTLYGDATAYNATAVTNGGNVPAVIYLNDGTNAEACRIVRDASTSNFRFNLLDGSSSVVNETPAVWNNNTRAKVAFAVELNNCRGAYAGNLSALDTSASLPTVTTLRIGHGPVLGSGGVWGGHIHAIAYFPRRLADADITAVTTP